MFHQYSSLQWSKLRIGKICNGKYIKLTWQKPSQFRLYIMCVIKAKRHGCVRNDRETHSTGVTGMVPTGSDESKLRTFQGPFQDQISHYKDFHGEFHNADIPNTSGQTILLNDRSDRSKRLQSIIDRKANLRSIICRFFYNCKIDWIIVMKTIYYHKLLGYEYRITLIYYSKNDISRIVFNSRHNEDCFMVVFIL